MSAFEDRGGDEPVIPRSRRVEPLSGYRARYGYPWRWAFAASLFWRLEHAWLSNEGQPLAPLARWAYGHRKNAERRGARS